MNGPEIGNFTTYPFFIMTKQFIRVLPFYSQPIVGDPELEPLMPVALWRLAENGCEGQGPDSPCDDSEGLYYTIAGDEVTYWCPRHWYESHSGPHSGQRLVPMTPEQHEKERAEHRRRIERSWREADEHVAHAAGWLAERGLSDQARRLHEARGAIQASIKGL